MPEPAEAVFLDCPFDDDYRQLFQALLFTIHDCGFRARCALEVEDSGDTRIERLYRIIEQCEHGIHDISRTELDPVHMSTITTSSWGGSRCTRRAFLATPPSDRQPWGRTRSRSMTMSRSSVYLRAFRFVSRVSDA